MTISGECYRLSGHFVAGPAGHLFLTCWRPASSGAATDCVVFVPPFGEEMNKCRHMFAAVARDLAARGIAAVVPDLFGTGDSAGDLEQATWPIWCDDLATVNRWCAEHGLHLHGMVATRLGAALARDAAASGQLPQLRRSVLWQPVFDGARFLTQFLRLRVSASLAGGGPRESLQQLRDRLRSNNCVDVAGYSLPTALAEAIEQLQQPDRLPDRWGATLWADIRRQASTPAPAIAEATKPPPVAGPLEMRSFAGEWFWSSTEITSVPDLVGATTRHLAS